MKYDQILQINQVYTIDASTSNQLKVIIDNKSFYMPQLLFSVLETLINKKLTYKEALDELSKKAKSKPNWIELTTILREAIEIGLILTSDRPKFSIGIHAADFSSAPVHIRMLNDTNRTLAYQKAIYEVVKKDDIVLDIGTGTGILAITAAQAGAKHVYAVETTDLCEVAEKNFIRNNLQKKITLIKGDSNKISLPEKASILISEIIGNDPLNELILPSTKDACKRLLSSEARLIPNKLNIYVLPLKIPEKLIDKYFFTKRNCAKWNSVYNIDFSELVDAPVNNRLVEIGSYECKKYATFSDPILVSGIPLNDINDEVFSVQNTFISQLSGKLSGFLIYFNAILSPNTELNLNPKYTDKNNSWGNTVFFLDSPVCVQKNELINFNYSFKNNQSSITIQK